MIIKGYLGSNLVPGWRCSSLRCYQRTVLTRENRFANVCRLDNGRNGAAFVSHIRGLKSEAGGDDQKKKSEKSGSEDGKEFFNKVADELHGAKERASTFFQDFSQSIRNGSDSEQSSSSQEDKQKSDGKGFSKETQGDNNESNQNNTKNQHAASYLKSVKLPSIFESDEKTWTEAFRSLFGERIDQKTIAARARARRDAEEAAALRQEEPVWYSARDKESGEIYYYNDIGETVWEKPEGVEIVEAEENSKSSTSSQNYFEEKIAKKAAEIAELEKKRDQAHAEGDVSAFKEHNKKVRELKNDIQKLSREASRSDMVVVEEEKSPWERFNDRLRETPLLKAILGIGDSEPVRRVREVASDAREALETSQNPVVYRAYSVYDSVFAENETGEAIREFRKLDPNFDMEDALHFIQESLAPDVVKAFLRGDIDTIDYYCMEGAGAAVKASIKERQKAGRKSDENILSIGDMNLAAAKVVDKMGPIMVVQFMVQQINCLYDMKGSIVEGNSDEIIGVVYVWALSQVYDEELKSARWRIREFSIGGTTPYL